ncbi:MAG: glycosyltransferase family 4 protein [Candidatus Jordarchaeales archaeon]
MDLNVCMLLWEWPPQLQGGLGVHGYENSKALAKLGCRVSVITRFAVSNPVFQKEAGVKVYRVPERRVVMTIPFNDFRAFLSANLAFNIAATAKIIELEKERRFDLCHVHDWLSAISGLSVKEALGKPMVFTVHSTESVRSGDKGIEPIMNLEKLCAEKADIVITVSNYIKQEVARMGLSEEKIRVIYNGVDSKRFKPASEREKRKVRSKYELDDCRVVLFLGRLDPSKGLDYLLKALPMVLDEEPETKVVIAGQGWLEPMLVALAKLLGVEDHVVFAGYVPSKELPALYSTAEVFVSPSLCEPFGITLLEAMACGTAVVSTYTGGIPEFVKPMENGILVDAHSPDQLAYAITLLFQDEALRRKLAENGRKTVEKDFTWEKTAMETLKVYEEVLESSS